MRTLPYKRRLGKHSALNCEMAKHKECYCRCGGKFHGESHKPLMEAESELITVTKEISVEDMAKLVASVREKVRQQLQEGVV